MAWWNCCCEEEGCYVLQPEDLPTVELPGWTAGSWDGGACCKCITLTPDEPEWTDECTPVFGTASAEYDCTWDLLGQQNPNPMVIESAGAIDCPTILASIKNTYCCPGAPFKIGEGIGNMLYKEEWKLLVSYRPYAITLCLSKQNVDCGSGPELKWVLHSRYCYFFEARYTVSITNSSSRAITVTGACFTEVDSEDCDDESTSSTSAPCTRGEAIADPRTIAASGGYACFDRVKYYDLNPTGNVTFTNADVPGSCVEEFSCETGEEYDTQFCISVNSWPCNVRPCWCSAEWTITESSFNWFPVSQCGTAPCGPGIACDECIPFQVVTPFLCAINVQSCCADDIDLDCDAIPITCFILENISVPTYGTENCCREGSELIPNASDNANLTTPTCHTYCTYLTFLPTTCATANACLDFPCNTTCCYYLGCDDGTGEVGIYCEPKYSVAPSDATSFELQILCTVSPVSVCINSPSWTLALS